jgi:hypothetical protein
LVRGDTIYHIVVTSDPKGDTVYFSTLLFKLSIQGDLLESIQLSSTRWEIRAQMIWEGDDILIMGRFDGAVDSLEIFRLSGSTLESMVTFYNPYWRIYGSSHYEFLKFKDKYCVTHSGELHRLREDTEYKAYISWINNDFSLDTITQLDYPFAEIHGTGVVNEEELQIIVFHHSNWGSSIEKAYQGYISLNEKKEVIHDFFKLLPSQAENGFPIYLHQWERRSGLVFKDGFKCFVSHMIWGPPDFFNYYLQAIDAQDSMYTFYAEPAVWTSKMFKYNEEDILFTAHGNGAFIHPIHSPPINFQNFPTPYITRINRKGEQVQRSSFYYFSNTHKSLNWGELPQVAVLPNRTVALLGPSRNPNDVDEEINTAFYSLWMVRMDPDGCLSRDRCNDIQVTNPPDSVFRYDQFNTKYKQWYLQNPENGKEIRQYLSVRNRIGIENMGMIYENRILVTEYLTENHRANDSTFLFWLKEGKLFTRKDPLLYYQSMFYGVADAELTYEFSLRVGDVFTLPYGHGVADVVKVDSITLIPGYSRKRITLQHRNPEYQNKYGDLEWIEGVGMTSGLLYYQAWESCEKYELSCFYDRNELRYSTGSGTCASSLLITPEFADIGPFCEGDESIELPEESQNDPPIKGWWTPSSVNTDLPGVFTYVFTPIPGQDADTLMLDIVIEGKREPVFDKFEPFVLDSEPSDLPTTSNNGIDGTWEPSIIFTDEPGEFTYTFTPAEGSCANVIQLDIRIMDAMDITDMDASAIWYSHSYGRLSNFPDCILNIDVARVVSDTLIGNRYSRIIGTDYSGDYYPASEIPLFQKDGKMYFYEDESWWPLYDFNAEVGDTVVYYLPRNYVYYYRFGFDPDYLHLANSYEGNPFAYIILDIDTITTTNGVSLKKFKTENTLNFHIVFMGDIIENIGSIHHLFGNTTAHINPECQFPYVLCYFDDDIAHSVTGEYCDRISVVSEEILPEISLFPNPGIDEFTLESFDNQSYDYEIFDMTGSLISRGVLYQHVQINTRDMMSGVYIIRVRDQKGTSVHKKWIKIR